MEILKIFILIVTILLSLSIFTPYLFVKTSNDQPRPVDVAVPNIPPVPNDPPPVLNANPFIVQDLLKANGK